MRKIVVMMMISMDGVIESPSSPKDSEAGFAYGGWTVPYANESIGDVLDKELSLPIDLLLGRKTYEIFAPYWPTQQNTIADAFNKAKKYVVSSGTVDLTWHESHLISGDVVAQIKALKQISGPEIQVHGSGVLVQTLLRNDLIDELHLRIFPVTIGIGQRLFAAGTTPTRFDLIESGTLSNGVIIADYKRAGGLTAGPLK